ncbi:hypothetical protein [Mucilaginibacter boryungensis]|uniref:Holliday junction resolvase RuvC n=1 Tax=Mucilaginibacter boryungensis TaxID=768480 RepID=A0ABR9XLF4_9SPHI|nr:hypothetical protein [Mucilaginibacter boryungensis]MBE9668207.1 hypothetical protein [Mucilaginibacter boryungensis]
MAVLGISPGTRTTGIAVVHRRELLECRTATTRKSGPAVHAATAAHYLRQYKIRSVAIKVPPATHLSERLKAVLKCLLKLFEYHGCMVQYSDTSKIKTAVPGMRNKRDLMTFASGLYPLLAAEQSKEYGNSQKYHHKMFEAVVIAHLHEQDDLHKNSP